MNSTLLDAARAAPDGLLAQLNTTPDGLSALQSKLRLQRFGPNAIAHEQPVAWPRQLLHTFR
ncbi:MAG: cation-transporting P-type ATPase, partial [Cyanobium sp.]